MLHGFGGSFGFVDLTFMLLVAGAHALLYGWMQRLCIALQPSTPNPMRPEPLIRCQSLLSPDILEAG